MTSCIFLGTFKATLISVELFCFRLFSGSFSEGHFHRHPAVMKLCDQLDLIHTCGYVSILNPYKEEVHEDDLDGEPFIADNTSAKLTSSNISSAFPHPPLTNTPPDSTNSNSQPPVEQSSSDIQTADLPQNGFKDHHSAEVLNSELDDLDNITTNDDSNVCNLKSNLHLDVKQSILGSHPVIALGRSLEALKEDDWVLLDLCFGLPLFNSTLNKDVCSRISKLGLFKQER